MRWLCRHASGRGGPVATPLRRVAGSTVRAMHHEARADELARVPLFARCSKRQLRRLADESHVEQIDPGDKLVTQGSPSGQLYVVLAGTASVERNGTEVGRVTTGDVVGELGLLFDEPRNADVVASSALEVLGLDRAGLQRALDEVPGMGWTLLTTVAERLADAERPH
jgi:CRP-like cAMP-binding protein